MELCNQRANDRWTDVHIICMYNIYKVKCILYGYGYIPGEAVLKGIYNVFLIKNTLMSLVLCARYFFIVLNNF